jgi:hypothetical protein
MHVEAGAGRPTERMAVSDRGSTRRGLFDDGRRVTFDRMHSKWRRATATLVGLWFTLSVSGVALQLCPQHSHSHVMAGMAHATADCPPTMDRAAGSRDQAQQHPDQQDHGSHDDCSCTGMCCVTAAVSLTAARLVVVPIVVAVAPVMAPPRTQELAPRVAPDVTLPLAIGPPTLRG